MSPVFSLTQQPNQDLAGVDNTLGNLVIDEDAIAPKEVSDQDFDDCNAVGDNLDSLIVGISSNGQVSGDNNLSSDELKRKIASDLLAGEFCNRVELVRLIAPLNEPVITLVAYACDSASGKIGDSALQASLSDYKDTYCSSAEKAIIEKSDSLLKNTDAFRTNLLPILEQDANRNIDEKYIMTKLNEVTFLVNDVKSKVSSGMHYTAATELDTASGMLNELSKLLESMSPD